jgi:hypothetical protein
MVTENFTANGTTSTFTVNPGLSTNTTFVIVNGVVLAPTAEYTISGTTLTLAVAPPNGYKVVVRELLGDNAGGQTAAQVAQQASDIATVFSIALG